MQFDATVLSFGVVRPMRPRPWVKAVIGAAQNTEDLTMPSQNKRTPAQADLGGYAPAPWRATPDGRVTDRNGVTVALCSR